MAAGGRKNAYVVSHTHWDREWYCTFEEYRFRLVEHTRLLLDLLKKDKSYKSFHFDGQVAPLLDYLQIRPEDEKELKRRTGEGRIVPGPWFVLADELIPGGESMVANMRRGLEEAAALGCKGPFCAYIPDQFGHAPQTPQVLAQFGMETAFMSRGLCQEEWWGSELDWEGVDGTRMFVYFNAYCNAQALHRRRTEGLDTAGLVSMMETSAGRAESGSVILMDGCDHFPPNLNLGEALKALSRESGFDLRHTTLYEAVEALRRAAGRKRLPEFRGELRYDLEAGGINLNGTLSSRIYLKQHNRRVETLLERWAEPFSAFAFLLGGTHHTGELRHARRQLLLNLPHDSICGCSLDRVHRQMVSRYEEAEEIAETVLRRAVTDTAALSAGEDPPCPPEYPPFSYPSAGRDADELPLVLANAVPSPVRQVVLAGLDLPPGWKAGQLQAADVAGTPAPLQPIGADLAAEWGLDRGLRNQETPFRRPAWVALMPNEPVPGCGTLALKLSRGRAEDAGDMTFGTDWMANSYLKVKVNRNGSADIEDAFGASFKSLNLFEDGGDIGGGYHYQKPQKDKVAASEKTRADVSLIESGPLMTVLKADLSLNIPAGLSKDFSGRSGARRPLGITVYYVLRAGSPFLEIRTVVENDSTGHRLRAVFPSGIKAGNALADTQFCLYERPVEGHKYAEHPQGRFVMMERGDGPGFMLMNRGLPEYEAAPDGRVYLTLMRSFSWMTHQWWPRLSTPDGEMKGRWEFEYAVSPVSDRWEAFRKAERYCLPTAAFVLPPEAPEPMLRSSLVEIEGGAVLSTIERSPFHDRAAEVRLYNPLDGRSRATLNFGVPLEKAQKVRLDGKVLRELSVKNRRKVALSFKPYEIVTVRVCPHKGSD